MFNFFEIKRSLTRLIEKIDWRWIAFEQLFFEILRIKCSIVTLMHEINYFEIIHFYIDAFMYDEDLMITQFRTKNDKIVKVSILYDAFTFNLAKRKYSVYKKKFCVLIKFVIKYDHFCKNSVHSAIIHTNHKSLIYFFKFDKHERIYEHWANKMRDFNVEIKYISERRNKIANKLFRTLFQRENCASNLAVEQVINSLHDQEFACI
jgi:tRNA nucleotidyltransferase/poly(A) polymerase